MHETSVACRVVCVVGRGRLGIWLRPRTFLDWAECSDILAFGLRNGSFVHSRDSHYVTTWLIRTFLLS